MGSAHAEIISSPGRIHASSRARFLDYVMQHQPVFG